MRTTQGSTRVGAQFNVGLMGLSFGYFLKLRHEPKYNTLTWTQDYRYSSDFGNSVLAACLRPSSELSTISSVLYADDNVGHWQVMPHPSRSGWTRLLYSCKVKLLPWIPEFVVSFLTASALTEVRFNAVLLCACELKIGEKQATSSSYVAIFALIFTRRG